MTAARAKITSGMLNKGFSLRSDSTAQLVFYRAGNTGTGGLIAAQFGAQASFVIVPQGNSSRVMVELTGISYPGTIREGGSPLTRMNGGDAAMADVSAVLNQL